MAANRAARNGGTKRKTSAVANGSSARGGGAHRRLIAIRLRDWSEWCRQVMRGVQRFAHDQPSWRVHVDIGTSDAVRAAPDGLVFDGMITGVLASDSRWRTILREGRTKVVAITAAMPRSLSTVPFVRVDDAKVARSIGQHLLAGGFRKFAYCAGSGRPGIDDVRCRGFLAFAAAEGCPCEVITPTEGTMLLPVRRLARQIARLPKPVGIATWNITTARAVIQACGLAGMAVPEEVAVVAWDDDPLVAETLEPTVSAVVLPAERVGFEAARLLDQVMREQAVAKNQLLIDPAGILHVRQSSDVSTLKDRNVHLAMQYINEHATEPLKVSQIAAALRVSRRKIEQDFYRVTSRTLHDAVMGVRLERAKQLLMETDWHLERVADRSGMGTAQTLIRRMLRHERMTPGQFRARFSAL